MVKPWMIWISIFLFSFFAISDAADELMGYLVVANCISSWAIVYLTIRGVLRFVSKITGIPVSGRKPSAE